MRNTFLDATTLALAVTLSAALSRPAAAERLPAADVLHLCVTLERGDAPELKRLLEAGADVDARCSSGWRPLHLAAIAVSHGQGTEMLRLILDRHPDVNARDSEGETPLFKAVRGSTGAGHESASEAVKLLLEAGADVKARDKTGATPLLRALQNSDQELAEEFLGRGADRRAVDARGQSILMQACNAGYKDMVLSILSDSTSGINAREKTFGLTALMQAAVQGHADVVQVLLLHGADPKLKSSAGQTARLLAETRGHQEAAGLLARYEGGLSGQPPAQASPEPKPKAWTSDVDKPAYAAAEDPDAYAVVVGIERYQDLPEARFAERDAQAVRAHLRALGFPDRNIVSLSGAKATKAGLIKTLETWLPNNTDERSRVFFYYSGHGAPVPETGEAYLVPSDGDPQYLSDTAYPLQRLYQKLGGLKAKSVVAVLDSCFSGAGGRSVLAKGTRPLVSKVEIGTGSAGKVSALTASGAGQVSGALEDQGHGLFTYYFLRGLGDAPKDQAGKVTLKGVYEYLRPQVQDRAHRDNREQTPQFFAGEGALQPLR